MIARRVPTLDEVTAMTALEAAGLSDLRDAEAALACVCTCHLRRFGQPSDDFHDAGATCPCQLTIDQRRAVRDDWLAELDRFHASAAGKALAVSTRRAREQAAAEAGRLGMSITIESQFVPLAISGTLRDTTFWFRERGGSWRLHVDGPEGAQIASGVSDPTPADAVALIFDHLDRYRRSRHCEHVTTETADVFCRQCGQRRVLPA
ncbi:hypothetical protein BH23ACT10_BH23ACT10_13100 [soil metagenome]